MHSSQLKIEALSYFVRLGCSEAERVHPQEVNISVLVDFKTSPHACETDELKDTLCYAQVEERLSEVTQARPYKTIENLAQVCWATLRSLCSEGDSLCLEVHKLAPPIARQNKGAKFTLRGNI